MKYLIVIMLLLSSNAFCNEEINISNFRDANAWTDARAVLASSDYYLIKLAPFGVEWIPFIGKDKIACWTNKYDTKVIYLSDSINGYEAHIDNVLRKEYAEQFNKWLTKRLIRNSLETECKI